GRDGGHPGRPPAPRHGGLAVHRTRRGYPGEGVLIDLSHVTAWVLDMDDTLYPREQGLMRLVQARINAYVVEAVGLDPETAGVLQRQFLDEHGTTLAGLMANYTIEPEHFLEDVHKVPMDGLEPNPALAD